MSDTTGAPGPRSALDELAAMLAASGQQLPVVTASAPTETDQRIFRGSRSVGGGTIRSAEASDKGPSKGTVRSRVENPNAQSEPWPSAQQAGDPTASYAEEIARWYTMTKPEREAVQRSFQKAGVYGDAADAKVPLGDPNDQAGFSAWEEAVTKARHLNFLGQRITVEEVVASLPPSQSATDSRDTNAQLARWYQMTPAEREAVQTKMFVAGMYGDIDANQVPYGQADPAGFAQWSKLVQQAMASSAAGKPATPESFLEAQASFALGAPEQDKVTLSSAASIAQNVDAMAQRVLGRKATSAEQRVLVAAFHAQERSYQTTKSGTVTTPDLSAMAEQQLRNTNPAEAGAHDVAGVFSSFLSMLNGVR